MYRNKTCGELRLTDAGSEVTLAGWVQKTRKMGGMTFVDLRDRYGITQLVFDESKDAALCEQANKLGREWCIQVTGIVSERESKNAKMDTGDIEILAAKLNVLSESQTPPFTIEHQLRNTITVTQIDERHTTHLSRFLYPASQRNLATGIGETQLTTSLASIHYYILYLFSTCKGTKS